MIRRRIRPLRKSRGCELHLSSEERQLLESLPEQLSGVIRSLDLGESPPENLRRLFPRAYSRDDEAEAVFQRSTRGELVESHISALAALAGSARCRQLDEETMAAWLTALNDLRLVLGTALGVTDNEAVVSGQVGNSELMIYQYLTLLQSELVDAMEQWLPQAIPGADDRVPEDPWGEPLGDLRWDGTPRPPWPPAPEL
jgi:hypothetical protein